MVALNWTFDQVSASVGRRADLHGRLLRRLLIHRLYRQPQVRTTRCQRLALLQLRILRHVALTLGRVAIRLLKLVHRVLGPIHRVSRSVCLLRSGVLILIPLSLQYSIHPLDEVCGLRNGWSGLSCLVGNGIGRMLLFWLILVGKNGLLLAVRMALRIALVTGVRYHPISDVVMVAYHLEVLVLVPRCQVLLLDLLQKPLFLRLLLLVLALVDVVEDGILDATEGEPPVKDGSAVLFVSLSEAGVLVELS